MSQKKKKHLSDKLKQKNKNNTKQTTNQSVVQISMYMTVPKYKLFPPNHIQG